MPSADRARPMAQRPRDVMPFEVRSSSTLKKTGRVGVGSGSTFQAKTWRDNGGWGGGVGERGPSGQVGVGYDGGKWGVGV